MSTWQPNQSTLHVYESMANDFPSQSIEEFEYRRLALFELGHLSVVLKKDSLCRFVVMFTFEFQLHDRNLNQMTVLTSILSKDGLIYLGSAIWL